MGYDIFKLLIVVLLLANERTSEPNNVFCELNTVLLVGLFLSANKFNTENNLIDTVEE